MAELKTGQVCSVMGSPPPRCSQLPSSPAGYSRPRRTRRPPDLLGDWEVEGDVDCDGEGETLKKDSSDITGGDSESEEESEEEADESDIPPELVHSSGGESSEKEGTISLQASRRKGLRKRG